MLPGAVQPGRDRPLPEIPTQPELDFRLLAPEPSPVPRSVDELRFRLNDIRIEGATKLPTDRFRPLYANLIGTDVTLVDLRAVADGIERDYRAAGYFLVRAFVPAQRVQGGIFTINVVEGFVATVTVEGSNEATQAITRSYLSPLLAEKPASLETIERGLLLADDIPGIVSTGLLRPSPSVPGASDLVVSELQPPLNGGLAVSNRGSDFTGVWPVTGDAAINGLFGPDHPDRAARCALEMDAFASKFAAEQTEAGIPFGITRIGVHTGPAVIGNFGSSARFTYTASGDAVNTAARLEALNKHFGTRILVSDTTIKDCHAIPFRAVASVVLKGKRIALDVFELLQNGEYPLPYLEAYAKAFAALEERSDEAVALFEALHAERPDDPCVALHLERLRAGEKGAFIVMDEK